MNPRSPSRDQSLAPNGRQVRENFKAWMGRSRVRSVVYHATNNDFDAFDVDRSDMGAHFGNLEQMQGLESRLSMRSMSNTASGMVVMPVWVRMVNPLRLKDVGTVHADGIADQLEKKGILAKGEGKRILQECNADWRQRKVHDPVLRQKIIDAGYDGIVYKNEHEGSGDSFIAFDPKQIKSAIGNSGLFMKDQASLTDTEVARVLELVGKARRSIPASTPMPAPVRPPHIPTRIRVFGSRADGSHREDSDMDVLLQGDPDKIAGLQEALRPFSIEQGGPLDLFVLGSVDNEVDLVAAFAEDSDPRSVGGWDDFDELMSGAREIDFEDLIQECRVLDGLWNQSSSRERMDNKKRNRARAFG
jgi:hypothetical protein